MDAFEQVVAQILERKGYWTQIGTKVELTKEEKRSIGRPSCPRWELDIVAYRGATNELLVVECKSYLDSPGVCSDHFDGNHKVAARYKLFLDDHLRNVVIKRLVKQLINQGFCQPKPSIKLCLAAGKIRGDESQLEKIFKANGWLLWTPRFFRDELKTLSESGYENAIAVVVTKLLLRGDVD